MLDTVCVERFLAVCAIEKQRSSHTISAYRCDIADYRRWLSGNSGQPWDSVDTLKLYLADLTVARRLAGATVRRRFACLRALFRWLSDEGLAGNPFKGWSPTLPRRRRLPRTLTRLEAKSLLVARAEYCSNDILSIIVPLMIATGMRVGEICKLQVEDVSSDGESIRVHGKGSRDRLAYVSDPALCRNLSACARDRKKIDGAKAPLFLNRRGNKLRPSSVRPQLRRLAAGAGIGRRVTPHMLRHTAATLLIETGVDIRFVQRLLGHSSIATTEIYTHVSDNALKATLRRADVLRTVGT
ncbi:MAG: tyrosine-type recombinase/integrase [Xanthobacteraceae bacterium]|nr:tyrosine-type recombinase/integrase [Xanthobacteraceae bacterium]